MNQLPAATCARAGQAWPALLLASLLAVAPVYAQEQIGTTVFARGVATADLDGDTRLIGNGTPIYEHDVLTIGRKSFAVVEFEDGTRMTLRPNTVFRVDRYSRVQGKESFISRLFKGGLRAVTGLVTKRNPDAFKLQTAAATIGIRGTDFSARLCDADCATETENLRKKKTSTEAQMSPVVGRVAFLRGRLDKRTRAGRDARLRLGGPVLQGDTLLTAPRTIAVVAFRDGTRVTLQPDTEFLIERHDYEASKPENSSALMRLVRGGLRAVTGLIARGRPNSFKIATPVATIGVRGTRFDLICTGTCADGGQAAVEVPNTLTARALARVLDFLVPSAQAQGGLNGLFLLVRFGRVASESAAGTFEFGAGTTAFIASAGIAPRTDVPLPPAISNQLQQSPRPEDVPVPANAFTAERRNAQPGLWAMVHDEGGHATIESDGAQIDLGQGEVAFVSDTEATRVDAPQEFQTADPYLSRPPNTPPLDIDRASEPEPLACEM